MGILQRAVNNIKLPERRDLDWPKDKNKLEKWLITGKSGDDVYTGKDINEESALAATAVWSAVTQLSQLPASLPLHFYQKIEDGKKIMYNDPMYRLLHDQPNPEMTAMTFREQQMGQILRYGFCCAEKQLDDAENTIALWPLISRSVKLDRLLGELVFILTLSNGQKKVLAKERVLYIPGFSQNGLVPYNPVLTNKQSIALTLAIEEYGARFFGNNARPDSVLEHPETLSAEAQDRLRKSWNEIHQGLEKSHRIAILEEGMKLHEFSTDPQKAQALETKKFGISDVARIFNMPVHMLKELTRSTNNNIEFQGLEFVIYTLRPWLVRFEQAYNIQLLTIKKQKKYFWEHKVDGLLRGDSKTRHETYAKGRQWGYYSANDVRKMENMNSIGDEGDIYMVPLNMVAAKFALEPPPSSQGTPIRALLEAESHLNKVDKSIKNGEIIKEKEIKTNKNENKQEKRIGKKVQQIIISRNRIRQTYHRLFVNAAQQIINREGIAVKKALKKYLGERTITDLQAWLEDFYNGLDPYIRKVMEPVIRSFAEQFIYLSANEIDLPPEDVQTGLEDFINGYMDSYVYWHTERSLGQLNFLAEQENPFDLMTERVDDWEQKRPEQIAEEQTSRLSNAIAAFVFLGAGLNLYWQTGAKPCPYCRRLNGKLISKGQYFIQAGDEWNPEKDNPEGQTSPMKVRSKILHPPLHRGCQCEILPG